MGNDFDWLVLRYATDWRERLEGLRRLLAEAGTVPAAAFRDVHERMAGHALVALGLARWGVPSIPDPVPLSPLELVDAHGLQAVDFREAPVGHLRQRLTERPDQRTAHSDRAVD